MKTTNFTFRTMLTLSLLCLFLTSTAVAQTASGAFLTKSSTTTHVLLLWQEVSEDIMRHEIKNDVDYIEQYFLTINIKCKKVDLSSISESPISDGQDIVKIAENAKEGDSVIILICGRGIRYDDRLWFCYGASSSTSTPKEWISLDQIKAILKTSKANSVTILWLALQTSVESLESAPSNMETYEELIKGKEINMSQIGTVILGYSPGVDQTGQTENVKLKNGNVPCDRFLWYFIEAARQYPHPQSSSLIPSGSAILLYFTTIQRLREKGKPIHPSMHTF